MPPPPRPVARPMGPKARAAYAAALEKQAKEAIAAPIKKIVKKAVEVRTGPTRHMGPKARAAYKAAPVRVKPWHGPLARAKYEAMGLPRTEETRHMGPRLRAARDMGPKPRPAPAKRVAVTSRLPVRGAAPLKSLPVMEVLSDAADRYVPSDDEQLVFDIPEHPLTQAGRNIKAAFIDTPLIVASAAGRGLKSLWPKGDPHGDPGERYGTVDPVTGLRVVDSDDDYHARIGF